MAVPPRLLRDEGRRPNPEATSQPQRNDPKKKPAVQRLSLNQVVYNTTDGGYDQEIVIFQGELWMATSNSCASHWYDANQCTSSLYRIAIFEVLAMVSTSMLWSTAWSTQMRPIQQ